MHAVPRTAGLRVVVDARAVDASGIGRYLREVLQHLFADPRFGHFILLGAEDRLLRFASEMGAADAVSVLAYDYPFYSPKAQLAWVRIRRRPEVAGDVVFLPHYDGPLWGLPANSVVTVQDLIHFKVPEAFPAAKRMAAGTLLRRVAKQAGRIIVTSQATLDDLRERLPFSSSKTVVIPLGVSEYFAEVGETTVTHHGDRYLLCVGNQKAHKHHVGAVEALRHLRVRWPTLRLVLAGRAYDGTERVRERARELGVEQCVEFVSDPSDASLRDLYRGAAVLLFPSLYEGFGLPVLEAMASGTPVVAARRSSIPEVCADAALLVDPLDSLEMSAAVGRILENPQFADELRQRGRRRAAQFSWGRTARMVADELAAIGEVARPSAVAPSWRLPSGTMTGSR